MRNTRQFETEYREALIGQLLGAAVTIAVIAVVAIQVPDWMIQILK